MFHHPRIAILGLGLGLIASPAISQQSRPRIEVQAPGELGSGRVLLFAQRIEAGETEPPKSVSADPFVHKQNFVAAREIPGLAAGARIGLDGDDQAYPASMSALAPGDYWVQAVLDRDHDYAYRGAPTGDDVVSPVQRITLPTSGAAPVLTLSTTVPTWPLWESARGPMFSAEDRAVVDQRIKPFEFVSPTLSAFHGRPITMRGLVVTPVGYDEGSDTYPVVYFTHGFAAGMESLGDSAVGVLTATHAGRLPPMIWVMLDQSGPFGTHEFADSVNTGPWATALTRELIPDIEARHRTDGRAESRFLMGHSSGGWAMLWLQVNHPDLFGGAWISAPDVTDFTDYLGVDITRPEARVVSEMGRMEAVLGDYGGQASSFEAVFSPRGADGRPMPLYDRATGAVDPQVARYWRERWDVSQRVRTGWVPERLDNRLHVWVGANDQFGLDRSVRRLEAAVTAVGGRADFTYLPGKGHFDLYADGGDRWALRRIMAWQMWKRARPNSPLADPVATPPAS
ncbi:alpha/beta hydrolase [Brevundimonas sp. NPDC092305]|uniref:alpha/beta hydrolase n=1 Tax=Brevundimonas sp. NPDC092305 TaxID=3363957 RepID=UPI00380FA927